MEDEDFLLDDNTESIPTEGVENEMMDNTEVVEETTEPTEVEGSQEQTQEPFLRVKYNKEERALTQEEALIYAQKGLNYDKIQEKLQQMESNPGLAYLNELAQRSGTDIDSLVNYWREQEQQAELNQLIQQNIPEELAREFIENKKFREQLEAQQREQQSKEKQNLEFKEFFDEFPNVKPEEIPGEVWEQNANGIPLKYAYASFENAKLRNELNILKTNQTNRTKAPRLGTTTYGTHDNSVSDPFLEGFDSV